MKNYTSFIDCSEMPDDMNCTLVISGKRNEVLRVALRHAIEDHGHQDSPELKKLILMMIKAKTNNK